MHAKLFGGRVVNLDVGEHTQIIVHPETPGWIVILRSHA